MLWGATLGGPAGGYCEPGKHPHLLYDDIIWGVHDVAERIIKSGYDVVVLNEVWWNDAEDILRDELADVYPYSVQRLSDGGLEEGSGLNIFSKLPFAALPNGVSEYTEHDFRLRFNGQEYDCPDHGTSLCNDYVAFLEYSEPDTLVVDDEGNLIYNPNEKIGGEKWADKGVGYVRVRSPDTGRYHNVFFTHMQATYKEDHEPDYGFWHGFGARTSQFDEVKQLVEAAASGNETSFWGEQDVFVLGDLNVDGDASNVIDSESPPFEGNLWEWTARFDKDYSGPGALHSGFFRENLHDTWRYEHPNDDLIAAGNPSEAGHTGSFGDTPKRLDYILSNVAFMKTTGIGVDPLCNQHPQLALNLLSGTPHVPGGGANPPGGRGDLGDGLSGSPPQRFRSDHWGVNAHYNKLADHCSPLRPPSANALYDDPDYGAHVLAQSDVGMVNETNDPANPGKEQPGKLTYPGSVQWHYLEWDGIYNIGFDEPSHDLGYRVQVYHESELSQPIKAYGSKEYPDEIEREELGPLGLPQTVIIPTKGKKYFLTGGPFLLKVYHPTHDHREIAGNESGEYALSVSHLGCMDKDADVCPLLPNLNETAVSQFRMPASLIESEPTPDSMYFEVAYERLTHPGYQTLRFDLFDNTDDILTSAVVSAAAGHDDDVFLEETSLSGDPCPPSGDFDLSGCNIRLEDTFENPAESSRRIIWRVHRPLTGEHYVGQTFRVVWSTDLTAIYGGGTNPAFKQSIVKCEEETVEDSPHDEIDVFMSSDGQDIGGTPFQHRHHVGRYNTGDSHSMDPVLSRLGWPVRFLDYIDITLIEDDLGTDDEFLVRINPIGIDEWGDNSRERRSLRAAIKEKSWGSGIYSSLGVAWS